MRLIATLILVLAVLSGCGLWDGAPITTSYAIIYGVTDYTNVGDVIYASNDAVDVHALLSAQWADDDGELILRIDDQATKTNLVADFAYIRSLAQENPNSRFVFYFAGHGFGDGMVSRYPTLPSSWVTYFSQNSDEPTGAGYYTDMVLLHDAVAPSANDVAATLAEALTDDELADELRQIASVCKIVIIDACHSGGFIGDDTSYDTVPRAFEGFGEGISFVDALSALTLYLDFGILERSDIPGADTIVMSAAGEQDFSYDSSTGGTTPSAGSLNGMFTYYFLESATNGDRNYDGVVTASEAYSYASAAIMSLENQYLQGEGKFVPRMSGAGVDFVLFETP